MLSVSDHNQAPKSLSSVLMCNLVHFKSGKAQGTIQGLRVVTVKWGLEKKKKRKGNLIVFNHSIQLLIPSQRKNLSAAVSKVGLIGKMAQTATD